jgi:hypothetical protein
MANLREEARTAGKLTYVTGKRCRQGHNAERYVSTGHCVVCQRQHSADAIAERNELPSATFRVYPREVQAFGLFALTLAAAHWPGRDLTAHVKRASGRTSVLGAVFVRVPCHPSDAGALEKAAIALRAQREGLVGRDVLGAVFRTAVAGGAPLQRSPFPQQQASARH